MLHRSTKVIATISSLIFIGSLCVLGGFAYYLANQKASYQILRESYAQLINQESAIQELQLSLEDTKDERESLKERIITEEAVIDFLALIERIGGEQQVLLTTKSLSVQPLDTTFETLVVSIDIEGSYASVIQTIRILESLPYQSNLQNVQIATQENGTWKGSLDLQITKFKKV